MAKKSMIARETRRTESVAKYAAKRDALKAIISNPESSYESVMEAVEKRKRKFLLVMNIWEIWVNCKRIFAET